MTEIQTNPALLAALKKAAHGTRTEEEIKAQRISFILGMTGDKSSITREHVVASLEKRQGKAAAA